MSENNNEDILNDAALGLNAILTAVGGPITVAISGVALAASDAFDKVSGPLGDMISNYSQASAYAATGVQPSQASLALSNAQSMGVSQIDNLGITVGSENDSNGTASSSTVAASKLLAVVKGQQGFGGLAAARLEHQAPE